MPSIAIAGKLGSNHSETRIPAAPNPFSTE